MDVIIDYTGNQMSRGLDWEYRGTENFKDLSYGDQKVDLILKKIVSFLRDEARRSVILSLFKSADRPDDRVRIFISGNMKFFMIVENGQGRFGQYVKTYTDDGLLREAIRETITQYDTGEAGQMEDYMIDTMGFVAGEPLDFQSERGKEYE